MRELNMGEIDGVSGGIIPAIWAGFVAYNYVVATYSAVQIAGGIGAAVGFGAAIAAATD